MIEHEGADDQWLQGMRSAYLSGADDKLSQLSQAVRSLEQAPQSATAYKRLDRLLHNLIGSGGSYGLQEVSEVARVMLDQLKSSHTDGLISSPLMIDLWDGVSRLRDVFAQAAEE
jgi:chemotaxis protein histidine kinase CheA